MTKVKVRHYVVKGGKAFWQPTPKMKALGFHAVPLGPDGPDAWAIAERWNGRWDKTRNCEAPSPAMAAAENLSPERVEELTVYPPRSLGDAFARYRRTHPNGPWIYTGGPWWEFQYVAGDEFPVFLRGQAPGAALRHQRMVALPALRGPACVDLAEQFRVGGIGALFGHGVASFERHLDQLPQECYGARRNSR